MRQTETTHGNSPRSQESSPQQGTTAPLPDSIDVGAHRAALMQRASGYANTPAPSSTPGPNSAGPNVLIISGPGNSSWHIFNGGLGVPHSPRSNSERFSAILSALDSLMRGGREFGEAVAIDPTTRYPTVHERANEGGRDGSREWSYRMPRITTGAPSQPNYRWEPTTDTPREARPTEPRAPLLDESKSERASESAKRSTERDKTDLPKETKLADPEKPEKEARLRVNEKSEEKTPERSVREGTERSSIKGESSRAEANPAGNSKPESTPKTSDPKTSEPVISREAQLRADLPRQQEASPVKEPATIVTPNVQAILNDSRNDIARLIAQVIAPDLQARPQAVGPTYLTTESTQYTSPNLAPYQASVNEKLSQIRDSLQSALQQSTPRQAPESPPAPSVASRAVGDYSIVDPPRRGGTTAHDIQRGDRAVGNHGTLASEHLSKNEVPIKGSPGIIASVIIPPPEGAMVRGIRPAGAPERDVTRNTIERASSLTDAISKAMAKIVSVQSLQRLDRALETSVIALAAAITLGVIGGRIALKELSGIARLLQRELRERPAKDEQGSDSTSELINDLEVALTQHGISVHEGATSQLVADITGRIVTTDNIPLESVSIYGGSLGMTTTDSSGIFRFSNIPLGVAYALTLSDQRYTFSPHHIEGTVTGLDHINVVATRVS